MTRYGMMMLLWIVPSIGAAAPELPCHLRVGWEPYAPYTFADGDSQVTGADIDIIELVAQNIGCSMEFVELPWARILREIETGALDVSTSTSKTSERTKWAWFSNSYRETEMAIYVRKGESSSYRLSSLADIPGQRFRLGTIVDYFYGGDIARLFAEPAFSTWIEGAPDYRTNIVKLVNRRIDGYLVEDVTVMEAELEGLGFSDRVERFPLHVPGEKLHFMFSKKRVDSLIIEQVDVELANMRADGRLQAIFDRYGI
jgi:polar amino acid transport system substrate-binding protein